LPKDEVANNNIKILVIDDEPDILLTLKSVLEQQRYYVRTFDKPSDALEHLRNIASQYDLVITDYRMPGGISGLDVARTINNDFSISKGNPRKTKILLITAHGTAETTESFSQALQAGLIDVIIKKPVSNKRLITEIEKLFLPQHNNNNNNNINH
jgi:CheY-like chemotaxis protein